MKNPKKIVTDVNKNEDFIFNNTNSYNPASNIILCNGLVAFAK